MKATAGDPPTDALRHAVGMSKAFTRESDDAPAEAMARPPSALPPGAPNYWTAAGARAALAEIARRRAADPEDPGAAALAAGLDGAVVVDPADQPRDDRVVFGAIVTILSDDGRERRVQIVGVNEVALPWDAADEVQLVSVSAPIARALLGARVGDDVVARTPRGDEEIEIVAVAFPEA